jgi:hypothetical protein
MKTFHLLSALLLLFLLFVCFQFYDPASKIWLAYIDLEKRACYSRIPPWEFHTQLQSKIQRVTGGFAGGLKRLTSVGSSSGNVAKAKKEEVKVELSNLPQTIVEQATLNHVAIVRDVIEAHYKNRQELLNDRLHTRKWVVARHST